MLMVLSYLGPGRAVADAGVYRRVWTATTAVKEEEDGSSRRYYFLADKQSLIAAPSALALGNGLREGLKYS
jgi:hypothetical protein